MDNEKKKKTGLEVIETVLKKISVPIVVITSLDTAKTAYEATLKGALEFYSKELFTASLRPEKRQEIYETLKRISGVKAQKKELSFEPALLRKPEKRKITAVVIASSTGGPKALSRFFSQMPADFPVPVIVVQHNSSGFDKSFVQWLDTFTPLHVKLAEEDEVPVSGTVYVAQTDKHLLLRVVEGRIHFYYNDDEPVNNQKPAADVMFIAAAECLKQAVISVVLTGMGNDGAAGTKKIKEMGGITLAQDEESSLIYGMPKAAKETDCVDMVLPLDSMASELVNLTE
jgi:two-component system chemotaxis response regulator CheB